MGRQRKNIYTRYTSSCRVVDYTQRVESQSLSMLPVYLRLSPTHISSYLEYIRSNSSKKDGYSING